MTETGVENDRIAEEGNQTKEEAPEPGKQAAGQAAGQQESQDQVFYDIFEEPRYPPTRALFMANLAPAYEKRKLQEILEENVKPSGCFIERAWLNKRRTHAIILVSAIEGAQLLRSKLHGTVLEPAPASHQTYIDYIPVKVAQTWIDQEDNASPDAVWRIDYEIVNGRIIVQHKLANYASVERQRDQANSEKPPRRAKRRGEASYRRERDWSRDSYVPANSRSRERPYFGDSYRHYGRRSDRRYDRYDRFHENRRSYDRYEADSYVKLDRHYQPRYPQGKTYRNDKNDVDEDAQHDQDTRSRSRSRSPVKPSEMDWDLDDDIEKR